MRVCAHQTAAVFRQWMQVRLVQDEAVVELANWLSSVVAVRLARSLVAGLLMAAYRLADEARQ